MHRHGHLGIALLILAPISYVLIQNGQFTLAGLLALGILVIESLLDNDQWWRTTIVIGLTASN